MSKHPRGGADEVRAVGLVSSQPDDEGGGVGERDARLDRRPAHQRRTLQAKGG